MIKPPSRSLNLKHLKQCSGTYSKTYLTTHKIRTKALMQIKSRLIKPLTFCLFCLPKQALEEIEHFRRKQQRLIFPDVCAQYILRDSKAEANGAHYHQTVIPQLVNRHLLDGFLLPSPTCRVWSVCCFHSRFIPLSLESNRGKGRKKKSHRNKRLAWIEGVFTALISSPLLLSQDHNHKSICNPDYTNQSQIKSAVKSHFSL